MLIRLFGKNLLTFYSHYIMELKLDALKVAGDNDFALTKVPHTSYNKVIEAGSTLGGKTLSSVISRNGDLTELFVYTNSQGEAVGSVCVMYKNGNDTEYRIRNIDSYIFGVYIGEEYRGNGYAGRMLEDLGRYLASKGIGEAHLAVSVKNKSGIRAYEKIGFKITGKKSFFRIMKINIPYYKL